MKNNRSGPLVWFITGTSEGFGKELVATALGRGDYVLATSRNPEKVLAEFPHMGNRLLALNLDLREPLQIKEVVEKAISKFGCIDVLVNNAGYGLFGAIEEVSDQEIMDIYEVNVFGLLRVTRAVLPYLRKERSGHIVNISSIVGLVGFPGGGIYSSTKFAVIGISESLAGELAPLGIGVTIVEPGPFRTGFLGSSLVVTDNAIAEYKNSSLRRYAEQKFHKEAGDPVLGAEIIVEAVLSEHPPLHLVLGSDAYRMAYKKIDDLQKDFSNWQDRGISCDFRDDCVNY